MMRGRPRTRATVDEHGVALPWGWRYGRIAAKVARTGATIPIPFTWGGVRWALTLSPDPAPITTPADDGENGDDDPQADRWAERWHGVGFDVVPSPRPVPRTVRVTVGHAGGVTLGATLAVSVPQRIGTRTGRRWWLVCPGCGAFRGRLYLDARRPLAGVRCRRCHGFAYLTQRLAPVDRLRVRAQKAYARTAGLRDWTDAPDPLDGCDAPPPPPRRKTSRYARECAAWLAACDRYEAAWTADFARVSAALIARFGGR